VGLGSGGGVGDDRFAVADGDVLAGERLELGGEVAGTAGGAQGDDTAYRDYRDRYRAMATSLGFEGHIAWAEAMP
jgi:hypothetical protein